MSKISALYELVKAEITCQIICGDGTGAKPEEHISPCIYAQPQEKCKHCGWYKREEGDHCECSFDCKGCQKPEKQEVPCTIHKCKCGSEWYGTEFDKGMLAGKFEQKQSLREKVGQLRQWLNEDRITDPKKMVTNEQIEKWLLEDSK